MANGSSSLSEVPLRFRGYDRAAAGTLFAALEQRQRMLAQERDDLRLRVEELAEELEQHRTRAQAVADALVTAQKIAVDLRTAAEADIEEERRGVAEEREHLLDEGATIRADARQEATEIVREARIRADRLIEEIVAALNVYQHEAEDFVSGSGERLTSLVHELLTRMPGSAPELPPELEDGVEAEAESGSTDIADVA
ncbi:MAG TPA: DivIVA domain-containing protein [Gaiellaceae bacterium]|nr:DivIVA domain-containing protein [Gaiellaceae bacterium]